MTAGATLASQLPKRRKLRIAAAYYATFVLLGLMLTAIGPSLDALQAQTGSSTAAIALLFTTNSLGYIAGSLLAARLYARIAGNRVLPAALVALAALTITVPWLGSLPLLLVVFALIGVPLGVMDVGGNTLIVWLYREDVPPFMNALHLSFGAGAFLGPLMFDRFAVVIGSATPTFWLFAVLMVPAALWLAKLPSPDSPEAAAQATGGQSVLRRYAWLIGLVAVFFFMHMGAEMSFGGWIYTYADGATGSPTTARLVNSVFWAGLVLGRLVAIPLAVRLSPTVMLQLDLLGVAAGLGILIAVSGSIPALWVGTALFGLAIASMIPSSFNVAATRMPITSQVSSLFLVGGSLGSMTLPWIVGQLYVPYGPLSVMWVSAGAMLAAWILFVVIARARARGEARVSGGSRSPA